MADNFNLKGFDNLFSTQLSNELQDNLVEWFDWALLQKGNYFNVSLGETSPRGYDYSKLRLSSDDRRTAGTTWEGFKGNWVWQSGVSFSPSPIVGDNNTLPGISGVYVDETFHPSTGTGDYSHYVDYYDGKIVFDSPIPTGSKVQAEYSYKWINVVYANEVPWIRDLQYRTYDMNGEFFNSGKGEQDQPPDSRLQLPAIAVEVVPRRTMRGYQLGGGQWVNTDILFHCIAEDDRTRNKLVDIVSLQNDKTIYMFESDNMAASGHMPLNYRGTPVSGAMRYPDLVNSHYGGAIRLTNSSVQGMDMINSNLYAGIVKLTTQVIHTDI